MEAIQRLSENVAVVVSLTLGGPHVNIKTFNLLGIHFQDDKSTKNKTNLFINHPVHHDVKILGFLDPALMHKLVRNHWAALKTIHSSSGLV